MDVGQEREIYGWDGLLSKVLRERERERGVGFWGKRRRRS